MTSCGARFCFVFHTINAYDCPDGTVVLDVMTWDSLDLNLEQMVGHYIGAGKPERWILQPAAGAVTIVPWAGKEPLSGEFPVVNPKVANQKHKYFYAATVHSAEGMKPEPLTFEFHSVTKFDTQTQRTVSWYPEAHELENIPP